MAKVYDVPADILINRLSEILKKEDIPAPDLGIICKNWYSCRQTSTKFRMVACKVCLNLEKNIPSRSIIG